MTRKFMKTKMPWLVIHSLTLLSIAGVLAFAAGCGGGKAQTKNTDFFTSGSREADQRASQRMAKEEQLSGTGEGAGEKNVKKAQISSTETNLFVNGTNRAAQAEGKLSLFDRLGGEAGISNIVVDFTPRAIAGSARQLGSQRREAGRLLLSQCQIRDVGCIPAKRPNPSNAHGAISHLGHRRTRSLRRQRN